MALPKYTISISFIYESFLITIEDLRQYCYNLHVVLPNIFVTNEYIKSVFSFGIQASSKECVTEKILFLNLILFWWSIESSHGYVKQ